MKPENPDICDLDTALDYLGRQTLGQVHGSFLGRFNPAIPRRLVQFWDQDPPEEIRRLLDHNAKICAALGLQHICYTDATARQFLTQHYSAEMLEIYDKAPHAAIRSDLFRYGELAVNGGWYLDADMALRENGPAIWSTKSRAVVFKWCLPQRRNICNWFFGVAKAHPLMQHVCARASQNCAQWLNSTASDQKIIRSALSVAGPGLFTRAIAEFLRTQVQDTQIATVEQAYRIVMNGPEYLRAPLAYKSTPRHWHKAGT